MSKRKNIPNSLKVQILRSYLKGDKPISELSEMHDLKPSQIYNCMPTAAIRYLK